MKRRLGIFCFYDKNGIADDYIFYLLSAMKTILSELIIVSNCVIDKTCKDRLCTFSNIVIERDNIGFDAYAYREIILKHLDDNKIKEYDEMVLFNDTYYGPFYEIKEVFEYMDSLKDVDFWGLSKMLGHKNDNDWIKERIQSYFLVFKNRIISDKRFLEFWNEMKLPRTYEDDVELYELGINEFLYANGFLGASYTNLMGADAVETFGVNPYSEKSYELISMCKFPFLRKKDLLSWQSVNASNAIDYISDNCNYNIDLIDNNIKRCKREGKYHWLDEFETYSFINTYKKIYIYGNGLVAKASETFVNKLGGRIWGNIVTKNGEEQGCKNVDQMEFDDDTGVIIGVGEKYYDDVYSNLKKYISDSHILKYAVVR